jgi:hypothetical protein
VVSENRNQERGEQFKKKKPIYTPQRRRQKKRRRKQNAHLLLSDQLSAHPSNLDIARFTPTSFSLLVSSRRKQSLASSYLVGKRKKKKKRSCEIICWL